MTAPRVLVDGLAFGESPRWHDGRLWLADWAAGEVLAVDADGRTEVVVRVDGLPVCLDWLPDGRLLVVAGGAGRLLRGSRTARWSATPTCGHWWRTRGTRW